MRVLGVDPGSRLLGFGCVDRVGNQLKHVDHGTIRVVEARSSSSECFAERLLVIHDQLSEVISRLRPQVMVVEEVFFAKNALSALKLGQARGSVLLTGKIHGLQIEEYSPTAVKLAIVGHGHADKDQVARMVQLLIGKRSFETADASDALALAICHAQMLRQGSTKDARL
jgi:crossover junction endodeoxyribonuclease RuvC